MLKNYDGIIVKGLGGLYEVRLDLFDKTVLCGARGVFRHENITPLIGDRVKILFDDSIGEEIINRKNSNDNAAQSGVVIEEIYERKNSLIRPPVANLDVIFLVLSAAKPVTVTETVDKLISIAEYNKISPAIIVTKKDLDSAECSRLADIYRNSGFEVFEVSSVSGDGIDEIKTYLKNLCLRGNDYVIDSESMLKNKNYPITAFAGASGAGKSSLMNALFPKLHIATNTVSRKIERGRHTTRHVELFSLRELTDGELSGYLADTPGFSMLDFTRFDFFSLEDLPYTFREFEPYLGNCRYTKCTHLREEGCAVIEALEAGKIQKSRHDSYVSIYESLKQKPQWKRDKELNKTNIGKGGKR